MNKNIKTTNTSNATGDGIIMGEEVGAKLETAPFFATPRTPSVHHTMGGLEINEKAQVLDTAGKPIDGLCLLRARLPGDFMPAIGLAAMRLQIYSHLDGLPEQVRQASNACC